LICEAGLRIGRQGGNLRSVIVARPASRLGLLCLMLGVCTLSLGAIGCGSRAARDVGILALFLDLRDTQLAQSQVVVLSVRDELRDEQSGGFTLGHIAVVSGIGRTDEWGLMGSISKNGNGKAQIAVHYSFDMQGTAGEKEGWLELKEGGSCVLVISDSHGPRLALQFVVIPTVGWDRDDWFRSAFGWRLQPRDGRLRKEGEAERGRRSESQVPVDK